MARTLRKFVRDRRGVSLVEYALIICLVSVAALSALRLFSSNTNNGLLGPSANTINSLLP